MSSDVAISVRGISKCYQIYATPRDRLFQMLARGSRRYYREFWALRDVSFEVAKGECVGIVGRNGSGKSTLLQMICGMVNPTSGTVATNGRVAALLELGSGFNADFTGRENVFLNGAILGLGRAAIGDRFDEIAAFADIGDFIEQPVKTYSSGMMMRLAFAIQVMLDPDILVVDEALAVGDEKFQRKCFARIEQLKSRGTSILFVSHSGPQVVELCGRALLLDGGARLAYAPARQVIRAYQKLIYAPAGEQEALIRSYRARDDAGDFAAPDLQENPPAAGEPRDTGSFDPALVPDSTLRYASQGAEIESIRLLDEGGREVNLLRAGGVYRVVVAGLFHSAVDGVNFAINLRSVSGTVITGQRYPHLGRSIDGIGAGERRTVTFRFRMLMLPGVYFASGGIWSLEAPHCLHRVVDALMFRILPTEAVTSFGLVDAMAGAPGLEEV